MTGDTGDGDRPEALGVEVGSTRTAMGRDGDGGTAVLNALAGLSTCEDALTGEDYENTLTGEDYVVYGEERVVYDEETTTDPERGGLVLRSGLPEATSTTSDAPGVGAATGAQRIAGWHVDLEQY